MPMVTPIEHLGGTKFKYQCPACKTIYTEETVPGSDFCKCEGPKKEEG